MCRRERKTAEYGEWNRKGATLSDKTAIKEYGIDREFIIKGIKAGKLEYQEASVWGNPFLKVLRSQLEKYIVEEFGMDHVLSSKKQNELREIKTEITRLQRRIKELEARRVILENQT